MTITVSDRRARRFHLRPRAEPNQTNESGHQSKTRVAIGRCRAARPEGRSLYRSVAVSDRTPQFAWRVSVHTQVEPGTSLPAPSRKETGTTFSIDLRLYGTFIRSIFCSADAVNEAPAECLLATNSSFYCSRIPCIFRFDLGFPSAIDCRLHALMICGANDSNSRVSQQVDSRASLMLPEHRLNE